MFFYIELIYFAEKDSFMIVQETRKSRLLVNNGEFYLSQSGKQIGWRCIRSELIRRKEIRTLTNNDDITILAMDHLLRFQKNCQKLVGSESKTIDKQGFLTRDYWFPKEEWTNSKQTLEMKKSPLLLDAVCIGNQHKRVSKQTLQTDANNRSNSLITDSNVNVVSVCGF